LTVNSEWGVVVHHIMNGSGVLKVYLINSRKYAYHLQFQRAVAPTWVLDALEQVSNRNTNIGFEENEILPDRNELIMDVTNFRNDEVKLNIDADINDEVDEPSNEDPNNQENETPMVLMRAIDTIKEVLDMTNNNNDNDEILQPEPTETTTSSSGFTTGESEGPVARIESIKMFLSIAAYENLIAIFKVDIGSAFMRTPMVDDVKHKWVRLHKLVVKILQELEYEPNIMDDGTIIMEFNTISYGLVEAAHYWYKS